MPQNFHSGKWQCGLLSPALPMNPESNGPLSLNPSPLEGEREERQGNKTGMAPTFNYARFFVGERRGWAGKKAPLDAAARRSATSTTSAREERDLALEILGLVVAEGYR